MIVDPSHPIGTISPQRRLKNRLVELLSLGAVILGIIFLAAVLYGGIREGLPRVSASFLTSKMSTLRPETAGIQVSILGSLWVVGLTLLFSLPVGIAAAIYLEEIAKPTKLRAFIQANIANLAGVPSIVFGLLGLAVFVRLLAFGQSILSAGLTMSLLVLPTIILVSQEALRMVPKSLREASLALGATPWQTLFKTTLPNAIPTIMTGIIFAAARSIGETAPLIVVGAAVFLRNTPKGVMDTYTVLPLTIYYWTSESKQVFQTNASAAIFVLVTILLLLNLVAIVLRNRFKKI